MVLNCFVFNGGSQSDLRPCYNTANTSKKTLKYREFDDIIGIQRGSFNRAAITSSPLFQIHVAAEIHLSNNFHFFTKHHEYPPADFDFPFITEEILFTFIPSSRAAARILGYSFSSDPSNEYLATALLDLIILLMVLAKCS